MRAFYGNVNNAVRGYAYLRSLGGDGLATMSRLAVVAANYVRVALADVLEVPYPRVCKHEVVFSARRQAQEHGVRALDIAKRLIDYGIHPPTIYFPLIVPDALMVEPTEDRVERDPGPVRGGHARHPGGGGGHPRAGAHGPPHHADRTPGRGDRRPPAGAGLAATGRQTSTLIRHERHLQARGRSSERHRSAVRRVPMTVVGMT